MAALSYLTGGEAASVTKLNALFGALDAKLFAILGGRTPLMAWPDQAILGHVSGEFPKELFGKAFFFTLGQTRYAQRVAEAINLNFDGTWAARPYNHAQFTDAAANATVISADSTKHILTINNIGDALYNGLPVSPFVGFFEHSLEAHKRNYPTASDPAHYLRETRVAAPEKKYRFAVAEIILDGITTVTLPASYDKYSCFRIHNLNHVQAVVNFAGLHLVHIPALGCKVVRRDKPTTNYRSTDGGGQFNYFFKFEAGDPRCYWHFPTTHLHDATGDQNIQSYADQTVNNAQGANNLANPAVLFEWVKAFKGPFPPADPLVSYTWNRYAWFNLDETELCDVRPLNSAAFGDPANSGTRLGDLIHHKGKIILAKIGKILKDPVTLLPLVVFTEFNFNGYATIVQDFAAVGLTVSTHASGNLQIIAPSNPDWYYDLIPIGTNLFKRGENYPTVIQLNDFFGSVPYILENAIFELQSEPVSLTAQSPTLLGPRNAVDVATTRQVIASPSIVISASYKKLVPLAIPNGSRAIINGIHNVLVSDLLDLHFFGDKNLASQETAYVQFTNRTLKLSNQGLVLSFTEKVPAQILPDLLGTNYGAKLVGDPASGWFENNRVIKFRGHGWGWSEEGKKNTMFWVPRYGRHTYPATLGYLSEISGTDGADWDSTGIGIQSHKGRVQFLARVKSERLSNRNPNGRFWTIPQAQIDLAHGPWEAFVAFQEHQNEPGWYYTNRDRLANAGPAPTIPSGKNTTYTLLPEHYNAMARLVNALKTGRKLSFLCLRWNAPGSSQQPTGLNLNPYFGLPTPLNCAFVNPAGDDLMLFNHLAVPLLATADFPSEYQTLKDDFCETAQYDVTLIASIANLTLNLGDNWYYGDITQSWSIAFHGTTRKFGYRAGTGPFDFKAGDFIYAADHLGFNPRPFAVGHGVHPLNLNADYAGFKWISTDGLKTVIEALNFEFVWNEVIDPYVLEKQVMPSAPVDGPLALHSSTLTNQKLSTSGSVETGNTVTVPLYNETATRIIFRRAENAGEANWKRQLLEANQISGPPVLWNAKNWVSHYSQFLAEETRAAVDNNMVSLIQGMELDFVPLTTGFAFVSTFGHLNVEFPPSGSTESDLAEIRFRVNALTQRPLLNYTVATTEHTLVFNLFPWFFWSYTIEWWLANGWAFLHDRVMPGVPAIVISQLEAQANLTAAIFNPATWPARQIQAGLGKTLILPELGRAYKVVYDPLQNSILLP